MFATKMPMVQRGGCYQRYDLDAAKALMEEAGWIEGDDGIREKDGEKQSYHYVSNGDSVRQALAEDSANQLRELELM